MTRLPVPGSDEGTWGDILNAYLGVEHNADGSLKLRTDGTVAPLVSGRLPAANLPATIPAANLGNGTASPSNFLRGDGTWAVPVETAASISDFNTAALSATAAAYEPLAPNGSDGQVLLRDSTASNGRSRWGSVTGLNTSLYVLWNTGDQICVPISSAVASATLSPASGQPYLTGGPGMVVPGGTQVQGISFVSNAAAVSPTHQFAFLAIPDETGLAQATVVAVSQDLLTAAWGVNTAKKFSFRTDDGGSGFWTPTVDTPVYGGIVQVASTPASLRSVTSSGQVGSIMTPKWFASSSGGVTTPATLSTVMALNDSSTVPFCRLSSTYN